MLTGSCRSARAPVNEQPFQDAGFARPRRSIDGLCCCVRYLQQLPVLLVVDFDDNKFESPITTIFEA